MPAPTRSPLPAGYGPLRPPAGARRAPSRHRRGTGWPAAVAVTAALAVLIAGFGLWSVLGAWTTPGNEGFSAKWADWMRGHGAASLVTSMESYYYSHHEPQKGGRPSGLNPEVRALPVVGQPTATAARFGLPAPAPVPLVVSPALPGEGRWQPIGPVVDGRPTMYESQFRADDIFTSQITTAVWMDPTRLRVTLVPGLTEPGGTWSHPPYITPAEVPGVVAAFNGGFRFQDARGGFYLDGRTAVPLVAGAASLVLYGDGRIDIGTWGTEVTMTPDVVAVLQNLVPMVDHGQISPLATYYDRSVWGATINTSIVVARSGVGVTRDGALVYVAGPALSAKTLAESLQRAGAVRAMTLDMNPEWVTFNIYSHPDPSQPAYVTASKLYPQMQRPADRYLPPTLESRDFFEVSLASSS